VSSKSRLLSPGAATIPPPGQSAAVDGFLHATLCKMPTL
jgi:hypothetical protein